MSLITQLKVLPQYALPQHALSTAMHWLTTRETPWLKNLLIKGFTRLYDINLEEAENTDPAAYRSFNDFFTRALKPDARPLADAPLISPADGVISQAGRIDGNRLVQAKGHDYTLEALLGGDIGYAEQFRNGAFAVVYLSPRDYHRVHMPVDGKLVSMTYVPGDLFAVNPATVENVDELFARNERLIIRFETETGPLCLIMVGAIFVGSMETVWAGKITPPYRPALVHYDYRDQTRHLSKGEEIGRFNMGSTVIILTPENGYVEMAQLPCPAQIRMGESLLPPIDSTGDHNETDYRNHQTIQAG